MKSINTIKIVLNHLTSYLNYNQILQKFQMSTLYSISMPCRINWTIKVGKSMDIKDTLPMTMTFSNACLFQFIVFLGDATELPLGCKAFHKHQKNAPDFLVTPRHVRISYIADDRVKILGSSTLQVTTTLLEQHRKSADLHRDKQLTISYKNPSSPLLCRLQMPDGLKIMAI